MGIILGCFQVKKEKESQQGENMGGNSVAILRQGTKKLRLDCFSNRFKKYFVNKADWQRKQAESNSLCGSVL